MHCSDGSGDTNGHFEYDFSESIPRKICHDHRGSDQHTVTCRFPVRWATEVTMIERDGETALILEYALDAVVGVDAENKVIFWNRRAEEIFGWCNTADRLNH